MQVPKTLPGLKWFTIVAAIFGVIWISLEGGLWQVILMATLVVLASAGFIFQRFFGGHQLSRSSWLMVTTLFGLVMGICLPIFTLVFMAVKTGLHGHGPEFSPAEIEWVIRQTPIWAITGLLAGLGIGVLLIGITQNKMARKN